MSVRAQLLLVPSASPARGIAPSAAGHVGSKGVWDRVVQRVAEEHGVYVALTQIVGFEGGKGFQGGSVLVGPDGSIMAEAPTFEEAIITGTFDRRALVRARADRRTAFAALEAVVGEDLR